MSEVAETTASDAQRPRAKSVELIKGGVRTASEFAALMSCLIVDVLEGNVSTNVCNAAVNAGGKLLKVVEMNHRYGRPRVDSQEKELILCADDLRRERDDVAEITRLEEALAALKRRKGMSS